MTRTQTAAVAAAAAGAVALRVATGEIPDSPAERECYIALGVGPCEAAQALADRETIDCEPGQRVTIPVEVVIDPTAEATVEATLPEGFAAIPRSARRVRCDEARRPGKVVTARPHAASPGPACIAGIVRRDVSEAGDGSRWREWETPHACCGDRCECVDDPCIRVAPVHLAGGDTWRARFCAGRPDRCD